VSEGFFDEEEDDGSEDEDENENDSIFLEKESVSSLLDELGGFENEGDIQDLSIVGSGGVGFNFDSSQLDSIENGVDKSEETTGDND